MRKTAAGRPACPWPSIAIASLTVVAELTATARCEAAVVTLGKLGPCAVSPGRQIKIYPGGGAAVATKAVDTPAGLLHGGDGEVRQGTQSASSRLRWGAGDGVAAFRSNCVKRGATHGLLEAR